VDRPHVPPSPPRLCRFTRRHRSGGGEGSLFRPAGSWLRAGAGCLLFLVLSCAKGDRVAGGTSETETGTATGQLVLKGGAAAQGARVTLFAAGEDSAKASAAGRTVITDASGAYAFDSLAFDTYNMTAIYVPAGTKDTLAASRLRIEVGGADRDVEVGVDTLRGPGAVSARVLFLSNPVEEALCFVPGTSYLALTDSGGRCLVSGIPPGSYRLSFRADGYLTARAPDSVAVATDDTVRLGDVSLRLDDRLAPPKPNGLRAVFDSSSRKVTLSWSRVPAGDLAGYALYRDSVAAVSFTRLAPDRLVQDTSFVDSLPGLEPGADTALAYRIKSQDRSGEQSGFALFDTVRVRLARVNRPPAVPAAPLPADGSAGASRSPALRWQSLDPDGDTVVADVYLGKENPPRERIASAVKDSFLAVPSLDTFSTYYWRVAVTDAKDTVPGPVWSFRTGTRPGESWTRLGQTMTQPMDMWFADERRAWAVGPFGEISHTRDGGYTWVRQNSGDTNWLAAVQFSDSLHGWAVGLNGTLLRTRDGGTRWERVPAAPEIFFRDVFFLDDRLGWVVGLRSESGLNHPVVLKTEDGGGTWTSQSAGNTQIVQSVQFIDANVGFLFAMRYPHTVVLRTDDGGKTWDPSDSIGMALPYSMHFLDADTGWVGGATQQNENGLLVDKGWVARTVDGGRHWALSEVPGTLSVASLGFADGKTGWAVGGDIHRTTDGGATWRREDVGGGGLNQFLVYFHLDRANGWVAGMPGVLYKRPPLPAP
jgi:photosystem II stability/assembly factor-like uncharacterized protein